MRMEAKHRDSTRCAKATMPRRNIPETLLERDQRSRNNHANDPSFGLHSNLSLGKCKAVSLERCDRYDDFRSGVPADFPTQCCEVSFVTFKGTKYQAGQCVVSNLDPDGIFPIFGTILKIFTDESEQILILSEILTTNFLDPHRHAY